MAKSGNSGWEPTSRAGKRKMANDWLSAFDQTPSGQSMVNRERWRLTDAMESQLGAKVEQIDTLEARPTQLHTVDSKKELAIAYADLTKIMRDIKRSCFMKPFLTDRDFVVLGLNIPDTEPTAVSVPTATPDVEAMSAGRLQVKFTVKPLSGSAVDKRADYGVKLKGCIVPRGEVVGQISPCGIPYATEAPQRVLDFKWDTFTRKSRFTIAFDNDDLGGFFYFMACYENSKGEAGPWGPIGFAVIA